MIRSDNFYSDLRLGSTSRYAGYAWHSKRVAISWIPSTEWPLNAHSGTECRPLTMRRRGKAKQNTVGLQGYRQAFPLSAVQSLPALHSIRAVTFFILIRRCFTLYAFVRIRCCFTLYASIRAFTNDCTAAYSLGPAVDKGSNGSCALSCSRLSGKPQQKAERASVLCRALLVCRDYSLCLRL